MTKTLPERLRARLITVPKPGEKPFDPPLGWQWSTTVGGDHKPKAGDDAGYMSINANMTGAAGLGQNTFKMQAMVYAVDPLCEEAAAENERLRAVLHELVYKDGDHWFTTMTDGTDVTGLVKRLRDPDEPPSAPPAASQIAGEPSVPYSAEAPGD